MIWKMFKAIKKKFCFMSVLEQKLNLSSFSVINDNNKQLLDGVFVICGIIKVEVSVNSRAEGGSDNTYRDLDNSAYHKILSNNCFIIHSKRK